MGKILEYVLLVTLLSHLAHQSCLGNPHSKISPLDKFQNKRPED